MDKHLSASCRCVPLLSCWHRYTRALRAPGSRGPALAVWSSAPNHGAVFSMHWFPPSGVSWFCEDLHVRNPRAYINTNVIEFSVIDTTERLALHDLLLSIFWIYIYARGALVKCNTTTCLELKINCGSQDLSITLFVCARIIIPVYCCWILNMYENIYNVHSLVYRGFIDPINSVLNP